jgi:hypothetical protein
MSATDRSWPLPERTWTFEAGDRVPEWLMRQVNCVLRFDRDAVVVEQNSRFQIYPTSAMRPDEPMVLAEIIDQGMDAEVEHVMPIKAFTAPRPMSLN